jgi:hypothetical protein
MATEKVQVKFRVSKQVKQDMDLLYKTAHSAKSKDDSRRWRIDVSQSLFWEYAVRDYLMRHQDLLNYLYSDKTIE